MLRLSELLPEPPGNRWEEVITAWATLLPSETVTPVKRLLARQAMDEGLMPADLAAILGTGEQELRSFFTQGEPLELEDDALVMLKRVLGLPAVALRVGLGHLRLTDLVSPGSLRRMQSTFGHRYPELTALLEASEAVALFTLLAGRYGDEPGRERKLLPEQSVQLPSRRR